MYFADEIRSPETVENLPTGVSLSDKEVQMAAQLISALSAKFDLAKFMDTYREQVLDLIQKKARGERIVAEPAPMEARVIDLMSALKSSLESVGAGRSDIAHPIRAPGSCRAGGYLRPFEDEQGGADSCAREEGLVTPLFAASKARRGR